MENVQYTPLKIYFTIRMPWNFFLKNLLLSEKRNQQNSQRYTCLNAPIYVSCNSMRGKWENLS